MLKFVTIFSNQIKLGVKIFKVMLNIFKDMTLLNGHQWQNEKYYKTLQKSIQNIFIYKWKTNISDISLQNSHCNCKQIRPKNKNMAENKQTDPK